MIEACHFFLIPSQSSSTPLYPSIVLRTREHAPTPCFSFIFNLRPTFESLKELTMHQPGDDSPSGETLEGRSPKEYPLGGPPFNPPYGCPTFNPKMFMPPWYPLVGIQPKKINKSPYKKLQYLTYIKDINPNVHI